MTDRDAASDEQQIRDLVATWMSTTKAGDVETVVALMADDIKFLVPGRAPFGMAEFLAATNQHARAGPRFDGASEVREVRVLGDWAWMSTALSVTTTQPGAAPVTRTGHTLSVLQRRGGRWQLVRDANLLGAPEPERPATSESLSRPRAEC